MLPVDVLNYMYGLLYGSYYLLYSKKYSCGFSHAECKQGPKTVLTVFSLSQDELTILI